MPSGSELFRSAHLSLACDHVRRIVMLRRTPLPFKRVDEIDDAREALVERFPRARRGAFSILNDCRVAPVRVEPSLEPAFSRYRMETEEGFRRAAVVVATPVGAARSHRLAVGALVPTKIFGSLEAALQFLTENV
jgi:hypothetical protein